MEHPADHLPMEHPLHRVNTGLRVWIAMIGVMLAWNAVVANGVLLDGWLRPIPFMVLAIVAGLWWFRTTSIDMTIFSSATIAVGLLLRASEVLLFGVDYDMRARMTAASVWTLIGGTTLVFGFLNLVAISRRQADVQVWGARGEPD